jgi:hypothetical protein
LREGELHRTNFVLPRKLTPLTVSGTIIFPDGTPAPHVYMTLVATETALGLSRTLTNWAGSFTLTGLSGSTYLVRATFYTSFGNGSAQTTISLADEPVTGLKLVLKKR